MEGPRPDPGVDPIVSMFDLGDAIKELLAYLWQDELEDFEAIPRAEREEDGHVFVTLVRLQNWLDGMDRTPLSYARELILERAQGQRAIHSETDEVE